MIAYRFFLSNFETGSPGKNQDDPINWLY